MEFVDVPPTCSCVSRGMVVASLDHALTRLVVSQYLSLYVPSTSRFPNNNLTLTFTHLPSIDVDNVRNNQVNSAVSSSCSFVARVNIVPPITDNELLLMIQTQLYNTISLLAQRNWVPSDAPRALVCYMYPQYRTPDDASAVREAVNTLQCDVTTQISRHQDHVLFAALRMAHNGTVQSGYDTALAEISSHPRAEQYVRLLHYMAIQTLLHNEHKAADKSEAAVSPQDIKARNAQHRILITYAKSAYANALHSWFASLLQLHNHDQALTALFSAFNSTILSQQANLKQRRNMDTPSSTDARRDVTVKVAHMVHAVNPELNCTKSILEVSVPPNMPGPITSVSINNELSSHDDFHIGGIKVERRRILPQDTVFNKTAQFTPAHKSSPCTTYPLHPASHYHHAIIRRYSSRKLLKPMSKLFPPTSNTDSKHMPIPLDKLLWAIIHHSSLLPHIAQHWLAPTPAARVALINRILHHIPVGTNSILTTHVIISSLGLVHSDLFSRTYVFSRLLFVHPEALQKLLKQVSALARKYAVDCTGRHIEDDAVAQIAYLELCFGRSQNKSDWAAERDHRCFTQHHIRAPTSIVVDDKLQARWVAVELGQQHHRDEQFYALLRAELAEIVEPLLKKTAVRETLNDFLMRRHEWMASGSASNFTADIPLTRTSETSTKGLKCNKRVWSEHLDKRRIITMVYKPESACEEARASEKYENGKSRAIYGTSPDHYVINTYVTQGMEERLHRVQGLEKGAAGTQQLRAIAKKCFITESLQNQCCMLDYADFNIHHTPTAQSIIFEEMQKAATKFQPTEDWLAACQWMCHSKANQRVIFPGDRTSTLVTQGMFSGTRSTDLINTLLNLAYFQVARRQLDRDGTHADDLYHVHQGDDLWLSSSNPLWTRRLYYTMSQQGFIFQDSKQMFGTGRGEFLRVLYSRGRALGYFQRALVNLLLKPIQSPIMEHPVEWFQSCTSTCKVLTRRGALPGMVQALWADIINHHAVARAHPNDKAPVALPIKYSATIPEFGGLGCPPPYFCLPNTQHPGNYSVDAKPLIDTLHAEQKMTDDWIAFVSAKHHSRAASSYLRASELREAIVHENYEPSLPTNLKRHQFLQFKQVVQRASRLEAAMASKCTVRSLIPTGCSNAELTTALRTYFPPPTEITTNDRALYGPMNKQLSNAVESDTFSGNILSTSNNILKVITRSTFKSISRTAQALGVSRCDALNYIISDSANVGQILSDDLYLLSQLIRQKRFQEIDLIIGGGSSALSMSEYWNDPNYVNVISSVGKQTTILASLQNGVSKTISPFQLYWAFYSGLADQLDASSYPTANVRY